MKEENQNSKSKFLISFIFEVVGVLAVYIIDSAKHPLRVYERSRLGVIWRR